MRPTGRHRYRGERFEDFEALNAPGEHRFPRVPPHARLFRFTTAIVPACPWRSVQPPSSLRAATERHPRPPRQPHRTQPPPRNHRGRCTSAVRADRSLVHGGAAPCASPVDSRSQNRHRRQFHTPAAGATMNPVGHAPHRGHHGEPSGPRGAPHGRARLQACSNWSPRRTQPRRSRQRSRTGPRRTCFATLDTGRASRLDHPEVIQFQEDRRAGAPSSRPWPNGRPRS